MPDMKTLTVGGITFKIADADAVKYTSQSPTIEEQGQARDNINVKNVTILISDIDGGHRLTFVDINGTHTVDLMDGENGYTPVKGTDYFTEADKAEMVKEVKDSGVLMYTEQTLTEDQKAQARANIGAAMAKFTRDTVKFDGNTDGEFIVDDVYVKVSDAVPDVNDFVNGCFVMYGDGTSYFFAPDTITTEKHDVRGEDNTFVVIGDEDSQFFTEQAEPGVYLNMGEDVVGLKIPGYTGFKQTEDIRATRQNLGFEVAKFERDSTVSLACLTHTATELYDLVLNGTPVICIVNEGYRVIYAFLFNNVDEGYTVVGDWLNDSGWKHSPDDEQCFADGDTSNKTNGNELWMEY